MPHQVLILLAAGGLMFLVIGCLAALSHYYTLSGIKSKTVGDGQYGTEDGPQPKRSGRPMPMSPSR